jgi:hypothetical protein
MNRRSLEVSEAVVKTRLSRARAVLRRELSARTEVVAANTHPLTDCAQCSGGCPRPRLRVRPK